ncbi:GNAT family N-acetyltransferase [Streptomyces sp. 3MP-14]|uniref:GNAT family N-acetyltransferase n=1 Tax=Streptomyces mimosae TaxID=2586635 RepID=A0A5N6ANL2_9ACTN|nr:MULTISPECIES: GNAT family N-acetyltransferase [Streptomyces]KAB8169673.1 GNAT family N-acetyltransferase [Streptomyces mimosae]KAB8178421.1 GNAT family N-acetyltransferase [Streptomyces sp. 3MP-14]
MTSTKPAITIRGYRPSDRDDLADICVRTAHAGEDATGRYAEPEIFPAIFATPYAELEPELVFVADNGERAIGYILGTADSTRFYADFRDRWLPTVADRFPAPTPPVTGQDDGLRYLLHHAEDMLVPEIAAEYPAHLHIDLLPEGQRQGLGRRLMETFVNALRERGVPALHLSMNPANTNARAFYDRIGFTELPRPAGKKDVDYLGMRL